ncbi:MAG: hypothetical protein JAZ18_10335 [Candidatus Thiodiazotropha endolucinida]|nr:hypothetical protein [Candidatus Thiodiazotropha endolucinida]
MFAKKRISVAVSVNMIITGSAFQWYFLAGCGTPEMERPCQALQHRLAVGRKHHATPD